MPDEPPQNLALMLDFVDDENTKYDETVLKAFLEEKNAYGYIASDNGKAAGFAYGYVLNEPDGQKVYYLHAIDVMEGWQNQGYGTALVRFVEQTMITVLMLCTMTALAAGVEDINAILYELWPEAARALRPLNLGDEQAGIRLDVLSAELSDDHYLVTYSLYARDKRNVPGHQPCD